MLNHWIVVRYTNTQTHAHVSLVLVASFAPPVGTNMLEPGVSATLGQNNTKRFARTLWLFSQVSVKMATVGFVLVATATRMVNVRPIPSSQCKSIWNWKDIQRLLVHVEFKYALKFKALKKVRCHLCLMIRMEPIDILCFLGVESSHSLTRFKIGSVHRLILDQKLWSQRPTAKPWHGSPGSMGHLLHSWSGGLEQFCLQRSNSLQL